MELQLIAALPGKSLENKINMCVDGRGGWTLSQLNVYRYITDYTDYFLVFCIGVLATDATDGDFVESTRLTARIDDELIGTSTREWATPNGMWNCQGSTAVFEWAQDLIMQPTCDGLITVAIDVKLKSQIDWLPVNGNAFCRITKVEPDSKYFNRSWESSWLFSLREMLPPRFRRRRWWSVTKPK